MRGHIRTRSLPAVAAVSAGALVAAGSALAVTSPAISSFAPSTVKAASKVTIAGKNLKGATWVKVDGMKMKFKVLSPTKIVVTLSSSAKSGQISVATAHGTATSTKSLTIT
jgi:IPT/TIG domain